MCRDDIAEHRAQLARQKAIVDRCNSLYGGARPRDVAHLYELEETVDILQGRIDKITHKLKESLK